MKPKPPKFPKTIETFRQLARSSDRRWRPVQRFNSREAQESLRNALSSYDTTLEQEQKTPSASQMRARYRRLLCGLRSASAEYQKLLACPDQLGPMVWADDPDSENAHWADTEMEVVAITRLIDGQIHRARKALNAIPTRRARSELGPERRLLFELACVFEKQTGRRLGRSRDPLGSASRGPFIEVLRTFLNETNIPFRSRNIPEFIHKWISGLDRELLVFQREPELLFADLEWENIDAR
jgi:hypothetical protein